ncbi:MAG: carboxypeptidase-like regulatory domain-containing protein [Planctomycetaceae bacterium]|jgi:hypothetical protein|nr:carboxypeptidase-like regulatory domain-containing protein [Planctomycetaceae bacterium]
MKLYNIFFNAICLLIIVTINLSVSGCSQSNPLGRLKIEGTVTLAGKPVNGSIEFEPIGNQKERVQSGGLIIDGKYRIPAEKGLVPGEYSVRIVASEEVPEKPKPSTNEIDNAVEFRDIVPPEYGAETKQKVTITKEKNNKFDFNM